MHIEDGGMFRITVYVPEEFLERMMNAVNTSMDPVYPGYDMTFSYSRVTGTWRPLEGSSPFRGKKGETEVADEIRLEFIVKGKDVRNVLKTIIEDHPYEEPAADVTEIYHWKDIIF